MLHKLETKSSPFASFRSNNLNSNESPQMRADQGNFKCICSEVCSPDDHLPILHLNGTYQEYA